MTATLLVLPIGSASSQSAFVRGFIDDYYRDPPGPHRTRGLNPRSCAASSMTIAKQGVVGRAEAVSIRVRARLHR